MYIHWVFPLNEFQTGYIPDISRQVLYNLMPNDKIWHRFKCCFCYVDPSTLFYDWDQNDKALHNYSIKQLLEIWSTKCWSFCRTNCWVLLGTLIKEFLWVNSRNKWQGSTQIYTTTVCNFEICSHLIEDFSLKDALNDISMACLFLYPGVL